MSDVLSAWPVDPVLRFAVRGGLASVLLMAAAHKLRDFPAFVAAVEGYDVVAPAWNRTMAAVLVGIEILAAGSLVLEGSSAVPAVAAAGLLCVYTLAIATNLWRGRRDVACGCGGPVAGVPIGPGLVARNLVLIGVALLAALPATDRSVTAFDAVTVIGLLATGNFVYASVETALANGAKLRRLEASLKERARGHRHAMEEWT